MSNKYQAVRAAKKAAQEARQREIDALDRQLCKMFAAAEDSRGGSTAARPAQAKGKGSWLNRYPGGTETPRPRETATTRSATDARQEMIKRAQDEDRSLATMNKYQADLVRRRKNGERFPE